MRQLLLFTLFWCIVQMPIVSGSAYEQFKQLPIESRFFIRNFFRDCFLHHALGHVLFFDTKPACLHCFQVSKKNQLFMDLVVAKGWLHWKKYEYLFPHPNFIFAEDHLIKDDEEMVHLFVINKKTFTQCIKENEALFQQVLGADFVPDVFIEKVENTHSLLAHIQDDDSLLGLILGFGIESSIAFKEQTLQELCPLCTDDYQGITVTASSKCEIYPIGFMGNPHSISVQYLVSTYEQELDLLWHHYQENDVVDLILEKLCSEH